MKTVAIFVFSMAAIIWFWVVYFILTTQAITDLILSFIITFSLIGTFTTYLGILEWIKD